MYLLIIAAIIIFAALLACLRFSRAVPVLMYHRVSDIPGDRISMPPEKFTAQMRYLRDHGFHAVSLAELHRHLSYGAPLPPRPVVLTFDDSYEDNLTTALPIMQEYGMKGTVFVISDWIGRMNEWESGQPRCRLLSWEQLAEWRLAGMEIASHTMTHPHLDRLTDEEITRELAGSKRAIEEHLGIPVHFLCYPYGDLSPRIKRLTRDCGYLGGVAIFQNAPLWRDDPYALRRVVMSARQTLPQFALKVSPLHPLTIWLRQVERGMKHRLTPRTTPAGPVVGNR